MICLNKSNKVPKPKSNWIILAAVLLPMFGAYFAWRCFSAAEIQDLVVSFGIFGPLIFILLRIATDVVAPLHSALFYLISEPLFGFWHGFLYLYVGEVMGYTVCFVLGRKYGCPFFVRLAGQQRLDGIQKYFNRVGNIKALLLCRLVLFGLQDIVSYAAGLTSISFGSYVVITAISTLLQTLIGVSAGRVLFRSPPVVFVLFVIAATAVIPGCWALWKRRKTKHN
jgi:uncharacterized membrane protein YdjX (TVP38/TMEM64 family)